MEEIDWADRAFYDDGEWVTWSEIDEQLRYKEWGAKYPNAKRSIIPYFEDLISLAESYHLPLIVPGLNGPSRYRCAAHRTTCLIPAWSGARNIHFTE